MTRVLLGLLFCRSALAIIQIDIDPRELPAGAEVIDVVANIGSPEANTDCSAMIAGPSGGPPTWHAVWDVDQQFTLPAPINSMTLLMSCNGVPSATVLSYKPFSVFYVPGPSWPPVSRTTFPGFEAADSCSAGHSGKGFAKGLGVSAAEYDPAKDQLRLDLKLPTESETVITMHDRNGALLKELFRGIGKEGQSRIELDCPKARKDDCLFRLTQGANQDIFLAKFLN